MGKRIEPSAKVEILSKLRQGLPLSEICKEYKISRPTLNKYQNEILDLKENVSVDSRSSDEDSAPSLESSSSDEEEGSSSSEEEGSLSSEEDNTSVVKERVFYKQSQLSDEEEERKPAAVNKVGLAFIRKHCKPEVKQVKPVVTRVKTNVKQCLKTPVKSKLKAGEVQHSEARESILRKIEAYLDAFPGKLAGFYGGKSIVTFVKSLQTKDHTYLQGMLEAMRFRVQNSGLGDSALLAFAFGTNAVETVGCHYGLKLKGFSRALQQNEAARQALKELSIEMLSDRAAKPHQRLALVIITTMYAVHSKNTLDEKTNEFLDQPLSDPGLNPELLEEVRKINLTEKGT